MNKQTVSNKKYEDFGCRKEYKDKLEMIEMRSRFN